MQSQERYVHPGEGVGGNSGGKVTCMLVASLRGKNQQCGIFKGRNFDVKQLNQHFLIFFMVLKKELAHRIYDVVFRQTFTGRKILMYMNPVINKYFKRYMSFRGMWEQANFEGVVRNASQNRQTDSDD